MSKVPDIEITPEKPLRMPEAGSAQVAAAETPVLNAHQRVDLEAVLGLDPKTVKPGMKYRWVRNEPARVHLMRLKGYEVVQRSTGVRPLIDIGEGNADGTITRGGSVILMATPLSIYQEGRNELHKLNESRLSRPRKEFEARAREMGYSAEIISDKGD